MSLFAPMVKTYFFYKNIKCINIKPKNYTKILLLSFFLYNFEFKIIIQNIQF